MSASQKENSSESKPNPNDKWLSTLSLSIKVKEVRVNPQYYEAMKNAQGIFYNKDGDDMEWNGYQVVCDESVEDIKFIFDQSVDEIVK